MTYKRPPLPDLSKARRVRVDDEGPTSYQAKVDRKRREALAAALTRQRMQEDDDDE